MTAPGQCPRCESVTVTSHCNAGPTCDWWRCGGCSTYGDHRRWAWKNPANDGRGEHGTFAS